MPEISMTESANNTHLIRLFRLRNLAIFGQICAVLFTQYVLDISLPLIAVSIIVVHIIIFNSYVWIRLNKLKPQALESETDQTKTVSENEIFFHLAFDVITLGLLLYFTGGATNPFVLLFLFPLTITVTILPVRYAWLLAALSVICYSLLMFYYQPLPMSHSMHGHGNASEYDLHLMGMWMAFILNACLITYYVYGMGNTLRRQQKQLSVAREQSIRDEQLVILGTLAASTAHELGTPLGTMSLLVDEIKAEIEQAESKDAILTDLLKLKKQIGRCKSSLSDLSASVGASSDLFGNKKQAVCSYMNEIISELQQSHSEAIITFNCDLNDNNTIFTDRTLTLSLINILENSIEASPEYVDITVSKDGSSIEILIKDKGPGLTEEALQKIGQQPYSDKDLGLGLGLYLAYAAIRRRNGFIEQQNEQSKGCKTIIVLPLATI